MHAVCARNYSLDLSTGCPSIDDEKTTQPVQRSPREALGLRCTTPVHMTSVRTEKRSGVGEQGMPVKFRLTVAFLVVTSILLYTPVQKQLH